MPGHQPGPAAGGEGGTAHQPGRAGRAGGRRGGARPGPSLAGPDRVPQGGGAGCPGGRRPHRRPAPARPAGRGVRPGPGDRRAVGPRRPARLGPQRRPGRGGPASRGRGGGHQQRPLRHPGRPPSGHRPGCGAGPVQPRRAGRVVARLGRGPPALRGRAGPSLRSLPRGGGPRRRPGARVRLRPGPGGPRPAALPLSARPRRDVVAAGAGRAGSHPALRAPSGRAGRPRGPARGLGPDRPRARRHRAAGLPRLLPDRVGHRGVLPAGRHLLPGSGVGGQLGGLLRPGHHQGRRRVAGPVVRALPVPRTRRPARHRHRHRERPARRGHPVRVRPLRAGVRGPGGQRHHLPGPLLGARHGPGPGLRPGPAGRLVQAGRCLVPGGCHRRRGHGHGWGRGPIEWRRAGLGPRSGKTSRARDPRGRARAGPPGRALPPPPGHPLGRHGAVRPAGDRGVPGGVGSHGGPHRPAVGQGRLRGGGPGQVRPAGPGHARARCTTPST